MSKSKKRTITVKNRLFRSFVLIPAILLFTAGCIRFYLRYTDLTGSLAEQRRLIYTISTNTASPDAMCQRRDALSARLAFVSTETSSPPDLFNLGESILKLLQDNSVGILRYRPLIKQTGDTQSKLPGFSFSGNAAAADLLRFLHKLSQEHSRWNVTSIMIIAGSTPGQLDIAFDIVTGPEITEANR